MPVVPSHGTRAPEIVALNNLELEQIGEPVFANTSYRLAGHVLIDQRGDRQTGTVLVLDPCVNFIGIALVHWGLACERYHAAGPRCRVLQS